MIMLQEKEVLDYIQEKYNPQVTPQILYRELKALYDYKQRKFEIEKGKSYKLGVYLNPRDSKKLNVFIPGNKTHYVVPADLFFSYEYPADVHLKLQKMKNIFIFTINDEEYRLCRNFSRSRQLIASKFLDHAYMLELGAEKYHVSAEELVVVPRIYGYDENSSLFWEYYYIQIDGKKKYFFFNVFLEKFQTQTYYPLTDSVTVSANQKQMMWRGTSLSYKKRKLSIGQ